MPMRGNCLFNTFSFFRYGETDRDVTIRREVLEHIENNSTRYEPFFCSNTTYPSWMSYIAVMKTPAPTNGSPTRAHWGGNIELVVAADLFKWQIFVYTDEKNIDGDPYQKIGDAQHDIKKI